MPASSLPPSSDPEPLWQELTAAALVGVERQPPAAPEGDGPLASFLRAALVGHPATGPATTDPAADLLRLAAAVSLYRRAGRLPPHSAAPLPPACPPDERPACSLAAGQHLASIIGGLGPSQWPEVLPEWLAAAARAGRRIPEMQLAALLERGSADLSLAPAILPVIGRRGEWLAAQNPRWEWARPLDPAAWHTGRGPARRLLLQRLRAIDPAAARELVASTWKEDPAVERAAFLGALQVGLSMADEPFLESALDDRSKEVRRTAIDLLACLPASRLVQRMLARAESCLALETGRWPLRRVHLVVTLPAACDPAMVRDGIASHPQPGIGERGGWLSAILRAIPPAHWSRKFAKPAAELLALAAATEWRDLLHGAWVAAARCHPDPEWGLALLALAPGSPQLLDILPAGQREAAIIDTFKSRPPADGMALALAFQQPWSSALTRLVLQRLRAWYLALPSPQGDYHLRQSVRILGLYMDPNLLSEAAGLLPAPAEKGSAWEQAIQSLLDLLTFRQQLYKEIQAQ